MSEPKRAQQLNEWNFLERHMLKRGHPRRIILDLIGWMWAVYFLWNQSWESAMLSVLGCSYLGYWSVRNVNPDRMAETALGRLALLHLHPANIAIQLAGFALVLWSVWAHQGAGILFGISVLAVGHLFGWEKVNKAFLAD